MTKEQKLKKIIERAKLNGFNLVNWMNDNEISPFGYPFISTPDNWQIFFIMMANKCQIKYLLLSNDFAKAYWGEEDNCCGLCCYKEKGICPEGGEHLQPMKLWKFNLTQAVLEEDIIEYYYKTYEH